MASRDFERRVRVSDRESEAVERVAKRAESGLGGVGRLIGAGRIPGVGLVEKVFQQPLVFSLMMHKATTYPGSYCSLFKLIRLLMRKVLGGGSVHQFAF